MTERKFEMTDEKRMEIIKTFLENRCFPIMYQKGKSSGGSSNDPNQGFDAAAMPEVWIDRYHVWWIYAVKQIWRIKGWIVKRTMAESLAEMCADVVNYTLILVSMLVQDGLIDLDEKPFLEKEMLTCTDCNSRLVMNEGSLICEECKKEH